MLLGKKAKVQPSQELIWLSEDLFLMTINCEFCMQTGLSIDLDNDAYNNLAVCMCLNCMEEGI